MSEGPLRDDHEAALARVEALEVENARLRAKLDGTPPPPKPEPPPSLPSPRRIVTGKRVVGIVLAGLVAGKCGADCAGSSARTDERVEIIHQMLDWRLMTRIGACVRATEVRAATIDGLGFATADPRKPDSRAAEIDKVRALYGTRRRQTTSRTGTHDEDWPCTQDFAVDSYWHELRDRDVDHGAPLAHFPDAIRRPLEAWVAREQDLDRASNALHEYYKHRDYLDDDFRAGERLWNELRFALAARDAAVAVVRRDALAPMHDAMRAIQRDYAARAGRDALWWRIELGFDLDALLDAAFRTHAAGDAVRAAARTLLERTKQAPIEVRRDVRAIAELDQLAADGPIAWDTIETFAAWPAKAIWDNGSNDLHDHEWSPTPQDPGDYTGCGGCSWTP